MLEWVNSVHAIDQRTRRDLLHWLQWVAGKQAGVGSRVGKGQRARWMRVCQRSCRYRGVDRVQRHMAGGRAAAMKGWSDEKLAKVG